MSDNTERQIKETDVKTRRHSEAKEMKRVSGREREIEGESEREREKEREKDRERG